MDETIVVGVVWIIGVLVIGFILIDCFLVDRRLRKEIERLENLEIKPAPIKNKLRKYTFQKNIRKRL